MDVRACASGSDYITCYCGCHLHPSSYTRHIRSNRHNNSMKIKLSKVLNAEPNNVVYETGVNTDKIIELINYLTIN